MIKLAATPTGSIIHYQRTILSAAQQGEIEVGPGLYRIQPDAQGKAFWIWINQDNVIAAIASSLEELEEMIA